MGLLCNYLGIYNVEKCPTQFVQSYGKGWQSAGIVTYLIFNNTSLVTHFVISLLYMNTLMICGRPFSWIGPLLIYFFLEEALVNFFFPGEGPPNFFFLDFLRAPPDH